MGMWFQKLLDSVSTQFNGRLRQRWESTVLIPRRRDSEPNYKKDGQDGKFRSRSASLPGRPKAKHPQGAGEQYSQSTPFSRAGTRLGRY